LSELIGESNRSRKLVLEVNIALSEGIKDCIKIYKGDSINDLLTNFCRKHNLSNTVKDNLTQQIEANINIQSSDSLLSNANITGESNSNYSFTKSSPPKVSHQKKRERAINSGIFLYERGMKQKERLEERRRKQSKLKAGNETRANTFRPKINRSTISNTQDVAARLVNNGMSNERKKEKMRTRNVISSSLQFNFTPNINKRLIICLLYRSQELAKTRLENLSLACNLPTDKHNFLFDDARKRKEYMNSMSILQLDPNCTFRPQVNKSKLTIRHPEKIDMYYRKLCHLPVDSYTHDEFTFKPKIGRPPRVQRNPNNEPVGDYLQYLGSLQVESNKKRILEEAQLNSYKPQALMHDESKNLWEKRKYEAFKEAFDMLDSDMNGEISAEHIDLSSTSTI